MCSFAQVDAEQRCVAVAAAAQTAEFRENPVLDRTPGEGGRQRGVPLVLPKHLLPIPAREP